MQMQNYLPAVPVQDRSSLGTALLFDDSKVNDSFDTPYARTNDLTVEQ